MSLLSSSPRTVSEENSYLWRMNEHSFNILKVFTTIHLWVLTKGSKQHPCGPLLHDALLDLPGGMAQATENLA